MNTSEFLKLASFEFCPCTLSYFYDDMVLLNVDSAHYVCKDRIWLVTKVEKWIEMMSQIYGISRKNLTAYDNDGYGVTIRYEVRNDPICKEF